MKKQIIASVVCVLFAQHAHAAYIVEDNAAPKFTYKQVEETAQFSITFLKGTSVFTKDSLNQLDQIKQQIAKSDSLTFVVRPDNAGQTTLMKNRMNAILNFFKRRQVDTTSLRFEYEDPDADTSTTAFLSTKALRAIEVPKPEPVLAVKTKPVERAEPRSFVSYVPEKTQAAARKQEVTSTGEPSTGSTTNMILAMVAAKQISPEDAARMLVTLQSTQTTQQPQMAQQAPQQKGSMTSGQPMKQVTWTLKAGLTLQENLAEWTAQMGWNPPIWEISDEEEYRIPKTRAISGDIGTVLAAIAKVTGLRIAYSEKQKIIKILPSADEVET